MMAKAYLILAMLGTASLCLLGGCSDPSGPVSLNPATITLGGASLNLVPGSSLQLRAEVRDSADHLLTDMPVEWDTADSTVVAIAADGTITARRAGTATITAAVDSIVAELTVTVHVAGLHAWPDTVALLPDGTRQLAARALTPLGSAVALSGVTWESSHPAVAKVDSTGMVTTIATGHATISAIAGDERMESEVYVFSYEKPLRFASVSVGGSYSCGLTAEGEAYCWGLGLYGTFPANQPTDRCERYLTASNQGHVRRNTYPCTTLPVRVGGDLRFSSLSIGTYHGCGIATTGTAYCWGTNVGGVVNGVNERAEFNTPVNVAGEIPFRSISAGVYATCGISTSNAAHCWGDNHNGLLGNGSMLESEGPSQAVGGLSFATVDVGFSHACGLTTDGDAYCWGQNRYGALGVENELELCGVSNAECSAQPVRVEANVQFRSIATGSFFTCGLGIDERAYCWGSGHHGRLGDGRVEHSRLPVAVPGSSNFADISAGGERACALDDAGNTFCWGANVLRIDGTRPVITEVPTRSAPQSLLRLVATDGDVCGIGVGGITVCWAGTSADPVPGQ